MLSSALDNPILFPKLTPKFSFRDVILFMHKSPHCLATRSLFWLLCKPFHNKVPACAAGCMANGSIHAGMRHLSHRKMLCTSAVAWLCQDLYFSAYIFFSCHLYLINILHSFFRVKLKCCLLPLLPVASSVPLPSLEVI